MTEFFEVHTRDGAARCGELRLEQSLHTPALADAVLHDSGSLWVDERSVPDTPPDRVTILPHRGFPTGTRQEVQQAFMPDLPDVDGPAAAVISPETAADLGVDVYVLSGMSGRVGHGRGLVDDIVQTRRCIPSDTALYVPGIATPATVALLCFAGVDLFDRDGAVIAGTRGRYLLETGEYPVESLDELPCSCSICVSRNPADIDRDQLIEHNVSTLAAALRGIRQRIREGRLREYLEGQIRHHPWLTAGFRVLDEEYAYLERRTAVVGQGRLDFTTDDSLHRVDVRRFGERVTERYRARLDDRPLVLLPCSATKPYSESPSHRDFREAIDYRAHIVSLTSPLGVVPDELELTYPAQHYETAVTGRWSASERERVAHLLGTYLDRADYPRIIAHVPEEGYRGVVEAARESIDSPPVTYTVDGHPTDTSSLAALDEALSGKLRYPRDRRYDAIIRAIADYQFGPAAGDSLFNQPDISGRYPRLRVYADGEQLATLVQQYGYLALTLAGADHWMASDVPTMTVEIDEFVPHGSVLAPGVIDASASIRVGDEVLVDGPRAFGVGRAQMSGNEMIESTRGIAVDVRHVRER